MLQHFRVEPSECLVFEDSYLGVLAAHQAGIEVVNIYDMYADIDREKIKAIADYELQDYKEAIKILKY